MNEKRKKLYIVYCGIKQRCEYVKHNRYKNYGGRGIKCIRNAFEEFYKDMHTTYEKGLTINRIDNDGNYYKENCERVTQKEQQNQRGNNIMITYKGKCSSITQWAEKLGYKRGILESRYRKGWDFDKIIETPRFAKTKKRTLSLIHKEKISQSLKIYRKTKNNNLLLHNQNTNAYNKER